MAGRNRGSFYSKARGGADILTLMESLSHKHHYPVTLRQEEISTQTPNGRSFIPKRNTGVINQKRYSRDRR